MMCSLKDASARIKMIHNFGQYLHGQYKSKGIDYVIAYLKASQLSLSKYLAHEKVSSLQELDPKFIFPRLTREGLPKIIGPRDRVSIRHGNRKVIILWMTIFGLYRVISGNYTLKLDTIVNPFSGDKAFLDEMSIRFEFISERLLNGHLGKHWSPMSIPKILSIRTILPVTSSSPNAKVSFFGWLIDMFAFSLHTDQRKYISRWLEITQQDLFLRYFNIFSSPAF